MRQSLSVSGQDWYESQSISHGIYRIRETFIANWLRCNIWLVRGSNSDLLIDSGLGLHSLAPMLATITQHPITAVMTHCHFDHMGGAHEFERRLGHKACNEMCHQPMSSEMNVSAFIRAETFRALPYEGFSVNQFSVITGAPYRLFGWGWCNRFRKSNISNISLARSFPWFDCTLWKENGNTI